MSPLQQSVSIGKGMDLGRPNIKTVVSATNAHRKSLGPSVTKIKVNSFMGNPVLQKKLVKLSVQPPLNSGNVDGTSELP